MRRKIFRSHFFPVWLCFGLTVLSLIILISYVDLKPQVDPNFFFSSDDPEFKADKKISELFPQPSQILMGVKGNIRSDEYIQRLRRLSNQLSSLPAVFSVQSLTHGPDGLKDALKSPLWKRILISLDGQSSLVSIFIENVPLEGIVAQVERIRDVFNQPGFEVMISGAPYVIVLIQRKLFEDLKVFSTAALAIFGLVVFFTFHSFGILFGIVVACFNASTITLIAGHFLNIKIGLLTANLSTLVFVITLSSIIFLTFNWRLLSQGNEQSPDRVIVQAMRLTFAASFWSMATTFMGFLSLLTVQAKPLRQLGISGAVGTIISIAAAYCIYPWFLRVPRQKTKERLIGKTAKEHPLLQRKYDIGTLSPTYGAVVVAITALTLVASTGLHSVNTDPDLLSYFRKGSEMREGLEYIDHNGGSSPLNIVIRDPHGAKFNTRKSYKRLWKLQQALESDKVVGAAVSLPVIVAEGKRKPLTFFMTLEWLLNLLESPRFGEIAKYFVTEDRTQALFMLRMKEGVRDFPRLENIRRIEEIVRSHAFIPELVGGIYLLQGKLSQLIMSSLVSGLNLLILIFAIMAWFISRSLQTTVAMSVGLCFIPITMLGLLGHFGITMDVISSPAANVAIGMGVDSMIHMLVRARILQGKGMTKWEAWTQARYQLWKPIFGNMFIVGMGFGIFGLSNFPPTQRFGFSVVLGTIMSPLASLFILPFLAGIPLRKTLTGK
ncbi:MAG: MMPL family transporter [Candidatus Omnitrophica bacterium]|nr:MMPL family transporter [Candidatus Omnitrophota bacterium]